MSKTRFMRVMWVYRWIALAIIVIYAGSYLITSAVISEFNPLLFHSITYRIIASLVSLAFAYVMFSRYLETRNYSIGMLMLTAIMLLGYYGFATMAQYELNLGGKNYDLALTYKSTSNIVFTMMPIPFYVYLMGFTRGGIRNHQLFLLATNFGMLLERILSSQYMVLSTVDIGSHTLDAFVERADASYITIFQGFTYIYIGIYTLVEMYRDLRLPSFERFQLLTLQDYVRLTVFFAYILSPLTFVVGIAFNENTLLRFYWRAILAPTTPLFAVLFIVIPYFAGRYPGFLTMQSLKRILVLRQDGIPLFEYAFGENTDQPKEKLFSGAISAINIVLSETLGINEMQVIKFDNSYLITKFEEELVFVLVSERESEDIYSGLLQFRDLFIEKFTLDKKQIVRKLDYSELEEIIQLSFGFV